MTLRLTDDQDATLEALAAAQKISKQEAVVRAVEEQAARVAVAGDIKRWADDAMARDTAPSSASTPTSSPPTGSGTTAGACCDTRGRSCDRCSADPSLDDPASGRWIGFRRHARRVAAQRCTNQWPLRGGT